MANTGTTAYPGALDNYTNVVGTTTYMDDAGYAHSTLHNQVHAAIEIVEATLGTTAATGVIAGWAAGAVAGKKNNDTFGTPTLNAPTIAGIGTVSGTLKTGTYNNIIIGTSQMTGGTVAGAVVSFTDTAPTTNVKARAYLGTNQENLTHDQWTKVLLDTESYDAGGDFASSDFICPVTGYYAVTGKVLWQNCVADKRYLSAIYVNGTSIANGIYQPSAVSLPGYALVSDVAYVAASATISLYAYSESGTVDTVDIGVGAVETYMSIHLLSV